MALHRIGNYELLGELGRGGMGVVYRGVDSFIKRQVAIKTIYLSDIQDQEERQFLRQRLYREAQSAGILSHPNIVTIYQIGEQDEITYIAMEYVEGSNLADLLRQREKVSLGLLLGVFEQTAAGLDHAHSHGVIHRDVKPANIIVRPDGVAKITDFGVAKISAQSVTRTGMTLGTPHFMAPEQIQGKHIDGKADQYSLGVVMYEAITGKKPFTADSMTTLIFRIVSDPVDPKRDNPAMGDEASDVLKRALAKTPEDRFPSCVALAQALRGAMAGHAEAAVLPVPSHRSPSHSAPHPESRSFTPPGNPATASMPVPTAGSSGSSAFPVASSSQAIPVPVPAGPVSASPAPPRPRDTRELPPSQTPVSTPIPTPMPAQAWEAKPPSRAVWLVPVLAFAGLAIVAAVFVIFWLVGGISPFSDPPSNTAGTASPGTTDPPPDRPDPGPSTPPGSSGTEIAGIIGNPPLNPEAGTPGSPVSGTPSGINTPGSGSGTISPEGTTPGTVKPNPVKPDPVKPSPVTPNTVVPGAGSGTSGRPAETAPGRSTAPTKPGGSASPRQEVEVIGGNTGQTPQTGAQSGSPGSRVPDRPAGNTPAPEKTTPPPPATSPRLLVRVPAVYPAAARRDGVSGTVGLRALVNTKGEPTNIEVTKGIRPDLDEAAKTALAKWRFQPGTAGGQPVDARVNVEISFSLVQEQRRPVSLRNP